MTDAARMLLRGDDVVVPVIEAGRGCYLAALAVRLRKEGHGPLLAVVPDAREAFTVAADALTFLPPRGNRDLLPLVEVLPAWESLPYEHISPSVGVMGTRLRVLWRMKSGDPELYLVVASSRAALMRVDPDAVPEEPLSLSQGSRADLSELVEVLSSWGYQRTFQVEARGEFAVRGGILDVWPAGEDIPLRLDFFGDEVEEIRAFSVSTQRSLGSLACEVIVFPARELRPSDKIRRRAEELAAHVPENASVWERFAEGIFFPGMESWLAWLVPEAVTPLELVPPSGALALVDPTELKRRAEVHTAEEQDLAAALRSTWDRIPSGRASTPQGPEASDGLAAPASAQEARPDRLQDHAPAEQPRLFADAEGVLSRVRNPTVTLVPPASASEPDRASFRPWPKSLGPSEVIGKAAAYASRGWAVVVAAGSRGAARRVAEAFSSEGSIPRMTDTTWLSGEVARPGILVGPFSYSAGFLFEDGELALLTEAELSPSRASRSRTQQGPGRWQRSLRELLGGALPAAKEVVRAAAEDVERETERDRLEKFLADLEPGDYVVHYHHGIGRYLGLVTLEAEGAERDYLAIEYAQGGKLYVPTQQLDAVRKYSGGERPHLNRLGGADWARTKKRARAAAAKIARYLVELYRERAHLSGIAFSPDTPWQRELEDSFGHQLTPDQEAALEAVKADMEAPRPMDRLVCGDVGFGKTEIAVRAAFKAVQDGFQVAVLVPTTILAQQHFETFRERFAPFPVRVEVLSRFVSPSRQRKLIEEVAAGAVDVMIGTHRLLQRDVRIPKLGLLIVDEEHRFGVAHKEALKAAFRGVDVLTLTATPIPRTLEMALSGIREVSTIETPPPGRQPVLTFVGEYDEGAASAAIRRELLRGGQVFYVHNRVKSIGAAVEKVKELAPGARVEAAHGQMSEQALEKVMLRFLGGKIDVLVTTTIVEAGLDIPSVNTLIVERADTLGLAELYQLRGRVGRGKDRAYAYFFYPSRSAISDEAYERLKTIGEYTDLGSGFAIARKDLEIRGAGNILGEAQSGHIAAVGLDLYVKMVSEAVGALEGKTTPQAPEPIQVDIPTNAYLPKDYISQESSRLEAYRKLAECYDYDSVARVREEWVDRYGPLPPPAERLLGVAELKVACARYGISECVYSGGKLRLAPLDLGELALHRLRRRGYECSYSAEPGRLFVVLPRERCSPKEIASLLEQIDRARKSGRGRERGRPQRVKGPSRPSGRVREGRG